MPTIVGRSTVRVSGSAQENGVIFAVLYVHLDAPPGALDQVRHL
jgi:hypothetical protein